MATPKQNYARQYQAYARGIEPDIPSSVRTYSIFNPDTGTWQRMTNGFRSPIPTQGQAVVPVQVPAQPAVDPVVQALALARQTQGRDWAMPLSQVPAQRPSRGSRKASPALKGGAVLVPAGQPQSVPQKASQNQIPVGQPLHAASTVFIQNYDNPTDIQPLYSKTNKPLLGFLNPNIINFDTDLGPSVLDLPEKVKDTNWNKVKYTGFPHTLGLVNESRMSEKERIARENGTYSDLHKLLGFYR